MVRKMFPLLFPFILSFPLLVKVNLANFAENFPATFAPLLLLRWKYYFRWNFLWCKLHSTLVLTLFFNQVKKLLLLPCCSFAKDWFSRKILTFGMSKKYLCHQTNFYCNIAVGRCIRVIGVPNPKLIAISSQESLQVNTFTQKHDFTFSREK